jgi:hypothetical protein
LGQIFENYSKIKFNENPYGGSCSTRTVRWTDVTKLIVALLNFANAPETYTDKLILCACEFDGSNRVNSFLVFNDFLIWQDYETSNHGVVNELEGYGRRRSWGKLTL